MHDDISATGSRIGTKKYFKVFFAPALLTIVHLLIGNYYSEIRNFNQVSDKRFDISYRDRRVEGILKRFQRSKVNIFQVSLKISMHFRSKFQSNFKFGDISFDLIVNVIHVKEANVYV